METQNSPSPLFSSYWKEKSIALLFSDSHTHRSAFAVQLATAIAEGSPILGFGDMPEEPRFVLYLDRWLSDQEFNQRYKVDSNPLPDHFFHAALGSNEKITSWKGLNSMSSGKNIRTTTSGGI